MNVELQEMTDTSDIAEILMGRISEVQVARKGAEAITSELEEHEARLTQALDILGPNGDDQDESENGQDDMDDMMMLASHGYPTIKTMLQWLGQQDDPFTAADLVKGLGIGKQAGRLALDRLVEQELVRLVGRATGQGRPYLYENIP